jgi:hypothetical protein
MTTYRNHDRSGVLGYVERHIAQHGYGPSLREIMRACEMK